MQTFKTIPLLHVVNYNSVIRMHTCSANRSI